MKSNFFKFILIVICGLISFTLFGCKQDGKIQFYRESALESALNDIKDALPKNSVSKSSGVFIYKDSSGSNNKQGQNVMFGPKDVVFDLPMNIR